MSPSDSAPVTTPELTVEQAIQVKRVALRLSRRDLSHRAGMSLAYVSQLENGTIHPSLQAFARLARELRLTPAEIMVILAAEARRPWTKGGH